MTLTGIDAAKSKEGEIVFRTDPPMTEAILKELVTAWILGSEFGIDGQSLVWRGGAYPERSLRQQTDIFLTEAENTVNARGAGETKPTSKGSEKAAKKPAGTKQHQEFLRKVSEQTGLPLV